jgi:hypothetical protein
VSKVEFLVATTALIFSLNLPASGQPNAPLLTGNFEGTGRACYGTLEIKTKKLSWQTPFSRCKLQEYQVINRQENGKDLRIAYKLSKPSKSCLYSVIELHRFAPDSPPPEYLWDAAGYKSIKDYESHSEDRLNCTLVVID